MDIADRFKEIRLVLYGRTCKTTLEHMANVTGPIVELASIYSLQPLHRPTQSINVPCIIAKQKMDVVAHQTPRNESDFCLCKRPGEQIEKTPAILVVLKDDLFTVATHRNVIETRT